MLRANSVQTELEVQILRQVRTWPEGTPISADALAQLGGKTKVGRALARLVAQNHLLRMTRGLYLLPVQGKFGPRAPAVQTVLQGLTRMTGETIVTSPATAANALGASLQVPVRHVFLTSGRTRRFYLGKLSVDLVHAPSWQLLLPGSVAGDVLRCLISGGKSAAGSEVQRLQKLVPEVEFEALRAVTAKLPKWLAAEIRNPRPSHHRSLGK
jgi:hypothetical protein